MSLGFVLAYLIGIWLFHEPWSGTRFAGILVIMGGVVLLTWPVAGPAKPIAASESPTPSTGTQP